MTRRMIDSGMWSNENFAALPAMARLLQVGIINHADDQGRIKAHPAYLRSQIFPYDDVAIDDMRDWLQAIARNGTIAIYEVDSKEYIQLIKWWSYQSLQYAAPSDYPAPGAWQDRIRYNAKGAPNLVLTHNWITTKGERLPDTCDQRGNILSPLPDVPPSQPPGALAGEPASQPAQEPVEPPNKLNLIEDQLNTNKEEEAEGAARPASAALVRDLARVWEAWDANMPGTKSPVIIEGVSGLLEDYSPAEIVEAISIACKKNKRTLSFVQGILAKGAFSDAPKSSGGDYRSTDKGEGRKTGYGVYSTALEVHQ